MREFEAAYIKDLERERCWSGEDYMLLRALERGEVDERGGDGWSLSIG